MARTTEQVLQGHMSALSNGDFPALMADYADDAVLMTMGGAYVGKAAIQGYFANALSSLPNAKLSHTGQIVHGDYALVTWTAVSDVATIPYGVDTFVITDDKIRLQTVWFTIVPKQAHDGFRGAATPRRGREPVRGIGATSGSHHTDSARA